MRQRRGGGRPVMSAPAKRTRPASGAMAPLMMPNSVDLPAPFGPMIPSASPSASARSVPSATMMAPNRLEIFSSERMGGMNFPVPNDRPAGDTCAGRELHLSPLAGRGRIASAIRVRGRFRTQRGCDCLQHSIGVLQHVIVPKAKNAIAVLGQPFVAVDITLIVGVLTSVNLNDDAFFSANEVY